MVLFLVGTWDATSGFLWPFCVPPGNSETEHRLDNNKLQFFPVHHLSILIPLDAI